MSPKLPMEHETLNSRGTPFALRKVAWNANWTPEISSDQFLTIVRSLPEGDYYDVKLTNWPEWPDDELPARAAEFLANISSADADVRDAWTEKLMNTRLSTRLYATTIEDPLRLSDLYNDLLSMRNPNETVSGNLYRVHWGSEWLFEFELPWGTIHTDTSEGPLSIRIGASGHVSLQLPFWPHEASFETTEDGIREWIREEFSHLGLPEPDFAAWKMTAIVC